MQCAVYLRWLSYEIPIALALLSIAALAGSALTFRKLSVSNPADSGIGMCFGGLWLNMENSCYSIYLGLFIIHFVASLAETNRIPFDIPEGESEIVAGYHRIQRNEVCDVFFC